MNLSLHEFQLVGRDHLAARERAGLFDDMGLGKTVQALSAAEGATLVVVPAVLRDQWRTEAELWRPDLDLTITSYHSLVRRERTERGGSTILPVVKPEFDRHFDTVIFDEAHNLKERRTTWTRAILKRPSGWKRTWLLSGTPVPNWAHELYVPLRLLHPDGDPRFSSYWRWVRNWFKTWNPPYAPNSIEIGPLLDEITWHDFHVHNNLDDLILRRDRDDVLPQLPPLTSQTIWLDMTTSQAKAYQQMKTEFLAWLDETGEIEVALTTGAQVMKLYKLTTGLPAIDPEARATGSNKLMALDEILADRDGQPTVVFTYFRNSAAAAAKVAKRHGATVMVTGGMSEQQRQASIESFQSGRASTLVGTLAVLREGLNLQNADVAVMLEHSHRPSDNDQAIRRLHRIGQTRPVTIIHLATRKSLDEHLRKRLAAKRASSSQAVPITRDMV